MNAWLLCLVVSVLLSGINGVMPQNGEYTLQHDDMAHGTFTHNTVNLKFGISRFDSLIVT